MWEKRKYPEVGAKPLSAPSGAAEPEINEGESRRPPLEARSAEPEVLKGTGTTIGKETVIKGDFSSEEDVYIDGYVEGMIELKNNVVTIGPNGSTSPTIKAREIVVLGTIAGDIEAHEKIAIHKNGSVTGDIKTAGITIEDGGYFKGRIDIVKIESETVSSASPSVKTASSQNERLSVTTH